MAIEFDDFTLINLKVLRDATLSLNMKLISPEKNKLNRDQTLTTYFDGCKYL